ncbi:MAG: hypothetical protein DRJ63_10365 [Thermoprotei archaeon]|nr:MAG: hypothetical protein DRJ63_10365 [Thermoprotei archaeon]
MLIEFLLAAIYAQVINIMEVFLWTKGLWSIEPPFIFDVRKPKQDSYHILLAILYFLPFTFLGLIEAFKLAWIVWILNDTTWHFWAVKPSYWTEWVKFYFNPHINQIVWYARIGVKIIKITPRRMFLITVVRLLLLPLILLL